MKQIFILLMVAMYATMFTACSKDNETPSPLNSDKVPLAKPETLSFCQGLSYKERWHDEVVTERLYEGSAKVRRESTRCNYFLPLTCGAARSSG